MPQAQRVRACPSLMEIQEFARVLGMRGSLVCSQLVGGNVQVPKFLDPDMLNNTALNAPLALV
eukprot:CAMPEP_0114543308 /NCGR_PEP_ID=MMETSP0114-20121206/2286_1 /TAXON_ID=31324 /ORGANISM="Goniomonas sp, Strain m" /LENGTH=62 /DNA_ID=CAMNT_0001727637 /DNA_START=138 /DNA_END=327 /DNA_ORIENTATION=+